MLLVYKYINLSTAVDAMLVHFHRSHRNTNEMNDQVCGRPAPPFYCEVKMLLLSKESGEEEDGNITFSLPLLKELPEDKLKQYNNLNIAYT